MYFYTKLFRTVPGILPTNFTPQLIAGFKEGLEPLHRYDLPFTDNFEI